MHAVSAFDELLLGESPEFRSLIHSAQVVAATDVTVLLLGESGTGKELLASAIHREGLRKNGPFIAINCAALPEGLAESELFGHRRGAFTGAVKDHAGRIRAAHGGTLFLDEVGELPLMVQAKLLRFLESGELQAVGDTATERAEVRIIAATHHDLHQRVQEGLFRADLFYRLNVVPLSLPSLRERGSDILLLLDSLTERMAHQHGLHAPIFEARARRALLNYDWPGNVREVRNFAERMVILFPGRKVEMENLPAEFRTPRASTSGASFVLPDKGIQLEELEQDMIRQALSKTHGNRSRAARLLGLTRDTLLYRLKKYAIN